MKTSLAVHWPFSQVGVERLGWILVHSVWQFAVLGLVGGALMHFVRRGSSTLRYTLLVAVMGMAASAPFATLFLQSNNRGGRQDAAGSEQGAQNKGWRSADATTATDSPGSAARPREPLPGVMGRPESKTAPATTIVSFGETARAVRDRIDGALQPSFPWIVAGWCVGVLFFALRPLLGWRMLHRLRNVGLSAPPDEVLGAFQRASRRLGVKRVAQVFHSTLAKGPLLVGCFRPVILLPVSLATGVPTSQLEAILAHELAHIRRHDFIVNLLQTLLETLFFYHPAVWWLSRRIRIEREHCCDDLVVTLFNNRADYGRALIAVENLQGRTPSLALGAADGSLLARIRRIAKGNDDRERRVVDRRPTAVALAIAVGVAAPIALLCAADEKPAAPAPRQESQNRKERAKLQPGAEEKMKWGEPVNGLRAAVVIKSAGAAPQAGDKPDLFLAVQNVSNAPIRLSDADVAPNVNLRTLYLRLDGKTQLGVGAREPVLGDLLLQPREVAFLAMFSPDPKSSQGRTVGSEFAEGALEDPHQTLVAKMEIEHAPAGAWTGKVVTAETSGAAAAARPEPKGKEARALFKVWRDSARKNGNIPGGLVGRLGEKVKEFIRNNTGDASGDPYAKKMAPIVRRFEVLRDWTPTDAAALLDDVAAITSIPLDAAMEEVVGRTIRTGAPLPPVLADAPWGEAAPNGLRMAWLLEPRTGRRQLGAPLKSRILFHNSGKDAIVFRTRTWHQARHTARDAKGAEIKVDSTYWTTLARLVPFRLAPGEYIEAAGAGVGVGANKNDEDWQGTRVGSWIDVKAGDEVTLATAPVPASDWSEAPPKEGEAGWWPEFIAARLAGESPLPADPAERIPLLDRVMRELFGAPPSAEEAAAFTADASPVALDLLANRLAHRPGLKPFTGALTSGATKFLVLPADPDASKKPRTATDPGRYTLGDSVRLAVSRRPVGDRIVNEARIEFFSPDPTKPAPGGPHEIKLPDGYNTWAAAWMRSSTVLWVQQKEGLRSFDFTNPAQVKEEAFNQSTNFEKAPRPILDALRAATTVVEPPASSGG